VARNPNAAPSTAATTCTAAVPTPPSSSVTVIDTSYPPVENACVNVHVPAPADQRRVPALEVPVAEIHSTAVRVITARISEPRGHRHRAPGFTRPIGRAGDRHGRCDVVPPSTWWCLIWPAAPQGPPHTRHRRCTVTVVDIAAGSATVQAAPHRHRTAPPPSSYDSVSDRTPCRQRTARPPHPNTAHPPARSAPRPGTGTPRSRRRQDRVKRADGDDPTVGLHSDRSGRTGAADGRGAVPISAELGIRAPVRGCTASGRDSRSGCAGDVASGHDLGAPCISQPHAASAELFGRDDRAAATEGRVQDTVCVISEQQPRLGLPSTT